jgi:TPR repeat protein
VSRFVSVWTTMQDGLSWCLWGAVNGNASAMWAAACCYRDAIGTRRNRVQAVRWYLAMLSVGDGEGVHEAITLAKSMSEAQIREAGRLAGREDDATLLLRLLRDRPWPARLLRPRRKGPRFRDGAESRLARPRRSRARRHSAISAWRSASAHECTRRTAAR